MGRSLRTTAYVVAAWALLAPAGASARLDAPAHVRASVPRADGHAAAKKPATGGAAAPAPGAPAVPAAPSPVTGLQCASRCGAGGMLRAGSVLRLRGRGLAGSDEVVFLGADGGADDTAAAPLAAWRTSVDVRVPLGAAGGPVALVDHDGAQTGPSAMPVPLDPAPAPPTAPSVEMSVRSPRAYFDAAQPPALTYVVHAGAPADVAVDLIRVADSGPIGHWDMPQVASEVAQHVTWNGTVKGKVQRSGRYAFRVTVPGVAAAQASVPDPGAFDFAQDRFPILGPHTFGTGAAAFGGPRGHQGQDTFAACGTPLVAAHGGVVKFAGYHARAGYYLVIDNTGSGNDYTYMHLREAALVKAGDRVYTGRLIGAVGDSGDADGCHLHFEIWTAPGWYSGGRPIDPLPALQAWDHAGEATGAASPPRPLSG